MTEHIDNPEPLPPKLDEIFQRVVARMSGDNLTLQEAIAAEVDGWPDDAVLDVAGDLIAHEFEKFL